MASRTPKHMPRCSARMIFISPSSWTLYCKVKDRAWPLPFKRLFTGLGLLDDFFEQVDVGGEGLATMGGERIRRQGASALKGLGHGGVTGLLQRAHVRRQIAVGHVQRVAHFSEREPRRGRQKRHEGQTPLLVYHAVELEKGFRVHASFFLFSVQKR